jgi:hypothetical protein
VWKSLLSHLLATRMKRVKKKRTKQQQQLLSTTDSPQSRGEKKRQRVLFSSVAKGSLRVKSALLPLLCFFFPHLLYNYIVFGCFSRFLPLFSQLMSFLLSSVYQILCFKIETKKKRRPIHRKEKRKTDKERSCALCVRVCFFCCCYELNLIKLLRPLCRCALKATSAPPL